MNKKSLFLVLILAIFTNSFAQMNTEFKGKTITFPSKDGITITADLYFISEEAPFIILYHQAGFSRGEYRPIAPKLNELGFNCISIDQRSGNEVNGIINQTYLEAEKQNLSTTYVDALPDIEAAFDYVKNTLKAKEIIIWGSSYSASLAFYMGSKHKDIKGILTFSPGEYFELEGKQIRDFAAEVECPVFITSSKAEGVKWQGILEALKGEKYFYLPQDEGFHGSRALWSINQGHENCWKEVEQFLNKVK